MYCVFRDTQRCLILLKNLNQGTQKYLQFQDQLDWNIVSFQSFEELKTFKTLVESVIIFATRKWNLRTRQTNFGIRCNILCNTPYLQNKFLLACHEYDSQNLCHTV
jgi:hypothetical protein